MSQFVKKRSENVNDDTGMISHDLDIYKKSKSIGVQRRIPRISIEEWERKETVKIVEKMIDKIVSFKSTKIQKTRKIQILKKRMRGNKRGKLGIYPSKCVKDYRKSKIWLNSIYEEGKESCRKCVSK